jgi:nitroreductase
MALADIIQRRHSVRHYLNKPVEREKIELCLEAARLAPSAANSQPWHFIVVDDPVLKEKLCKQAFNGVYRITKFPREAPVVVAAVARPTSGKIRLGNIFLRTNFGLIDMGIAGEHFALQAAELGLGTCWIGLFDQKAAKKVLGIPRGYVVVNLFTLGYSDESRDRRKHQRRSMGEIASYNGFTSNLG